MEDGGLPSGRNLGAFRGLGYDKGRSWLVQAMWFAVLNLLFKTWWCPARLRPRLLQLFGAEVGEGVLIRHRVRVLWPWKLAIGDNTWVGEGAWFLNLEPITIGSNVCVSQEAFLCTGSHDANSPTFEFDNAAVRVEDGAWVATQALILRGVTIGQGAVVGARAVVAHDVKPQAVISSNSFH